MSNSGAAAAAEVPDANMPAEGYAMEQDDDNYEDDAHVESPAKAQPIDDGEPRKNTEEVV